MNRTRNAFRVISLIAGAAVVSSVGHGQPAGLEGRSQSERPTYGGNLASHRYSPLDQINKDNFKDLEKPPGPGGLGPRPGGLFLQVTAVNGVAGVAAVHIAADRARTQAGPSIAKTDAANFLAHPELAAETFGPFMLVVTVDDLDQMRECAQALEGQLTATLHGTEADLFQARKLIEAGERIAGRLIVNGYPTGVEVCPSMHHGGPYPATTDVRFTSVGTAAILRFARPVCYQGFADALLPVELGNANVRGILRTVDGAPTRDKIDASPV